jgi:hypothetical protein
VKYGYFMSSVTIMVMIILTYVQRTPQRDDETNVLDSGLWETRTELYFQLYTGTVRITETLQ